MHVQGRADPANIRLDEREDLSTLKRAIRVECGLPGLAFDLVVRSPNASAEPLRESREELRRVLRLDSTGRWCVCVELPQTRWATSVDSSLPLAEVDDDGDDDDEKMSAPSSSTNSRYLYDSLCCCSSYPTTLATWSGFIKDALDFNINTFEGSPKWPEFTNTSKIIHEAHVHWTDQSYFAERNASACSLENQTSLDLIPTTKSAASSKLSPHGLRRSLAWWISWSVLTLEK